MTDTGLTRLLLVLDKQWGSSRAVRVIDEALLDGVIANPSALKEQHMVRLLETFLRLRKEQVRSLGWKIQKIVSLVENNAPENSWAVFLAQVVKEHHGGDTGYIDQEARSLIDTKNLSIRLRMSMVPAEMGGLHPSLLPPSLLDSVVNHPLPFTVLKPIRGHPSLNTEGEDTKL
ncbi:hypothetical protein AAMO2058_000630700 [Amorphochlora amoebiformis]